MKMFDAYYSAPTSEWNWLMLFLQIVMHRKRTMLEYLHLRKFATTKMKIRRRRRICLQKWKFLSIHWWWDLLDQTTEVCQLFHLSQSWKKKKNCRSFEIVTLPYMVFFGHNFPKSGKKIFEKCENESNMIGSAANRVVLSPPSSP